MFAQKMKKMSFLVGIQATFMLMLLALFCSTAAAQTTGTIYGQVSDPSGAAVPETNITAENTATGLVRKGVSTPVGSYLVPSLPPGPYKLTVEHAGFKTYVRSGITVIVGENARVDATLEIGAVTQSVEVTANAMKVDTQSTTVGTTVDNLRVQAMPLNGRNVLALVQLLPGVGTARFETQTINARSGPGVNVSGSRATANNLMLDGTFMFEPMYNWGINLPSPDALQEFRVLTNSYDAEYGRASGGVFLAVTKSGTNQFHGSLFEYLRNDALNARNFFAAGKPILRQNQFGGSIGGPVILPGYHGRDRTFFFFAFQGTRIRQQTLLTDFPATAAERAGDFSASSKPIIDPTTGLQFPGNQIPSGRFDPMAHNLLTKYVELPNRSDGRYVALLKLPLSGNDYTAKIDHQFSESSRLTVRYYRNGSQSENSESATASSVGKGLGGTPSNLYQTEAIKYTKIINPRLLNEAVVSHLRSNPYIEPGTGVLSPKELGGNYGTGGSYHLTPTASVVGRFTVGSTILFGEPEDVFLFGDKIHWERGRHSISAGVQVQRLRHLTRAQFGSGAGTFTGAFTGNAFADYLLGRPVLFSDESLLEEQERAGNYHLFVQDNIKINRRLTLNLGLRYELNPPWEQVHGWSGILRKGEQSQKFPTAPPGLVWPGDDAIPPGLIPTDKNNFLPRIGFAWDPTGTGRTSIRAAYGVFLNYSGAILNAVNTIPPYRLRISMSAPPSFSDPFNVAGGGTDPYPYQIDLQNPRFWFPMLATNINPDYKEGYVQHFNFNIQHQIGSVFVQAGYVGDVGRKLPGIHEINMAVFGPGATAANVQARRPYFPQYYGSIGEITSDINSSYHSLQASMNKRFSRGYTLELAYTFSKSIDASSIPNIDGTSVQDGANYLRGQRGLSDFDQRHILAVNGIWQLPFMKGNRFLGGWQLAGLTRVTSGIPFSSNSGCDCALIGSGRPNGPQRNNIIGDWRLDPNRPRGELVAAYFDKSAFARPQTGLFGNSGRNILIGPGYSQTNLSLQKKFRLPGERGDIEFRADFFNVFNQVNFGNPDNTFSSPGFGRLLSAQDARIVQLALRYDF